INATWNLLRRETGAKPGAAFVEDVESVRLSQTTAEERAEGLGSRLQDEKSKEHLAAVLEQMQKAVTQLQEAHDTPARDPLTPALAAEQAAYQALLKLRAREHEIIHQQGQRGQNASRSQQQREQMRQLDLKNERNRYESQRTAQEQQQESAEER